MSQLTPVSFRDRDFQRGDVLLPAEFEEPSGFRPGRVPPTPNLMADYLAHAGALADRDPAGCRAWWIAESLAEPGRDAGV